MAIRAVNFDKQKVKSTDDAIANSLALATSSCVYAGCEISQSGANSVSISAGVFFICGRLVYVTSSETIGIPGVSAGAYARVVFEADMNQTNTETDFTQGRFRVLTDTTNYPNIASGDVNLGATLHQMPFAKLRVDAAGVIAGSLVDERAMFYSVATLKSAVDGKAATTHTHTALSSLNITGNVGVNVPQVVNVVIYSGSTPALTGLANGTLFVKYVP